MSTDKRWIGVDLDGTLAHYDGWHGSDHIGAPIPRMMSRVNTWLQKGWTVKIMTARAADPMSVEAIKEWMREYGLPQLEITDRKDYHMIALFDDRAVAVAPNIGTCLVANPALENLL